MHFVMCQMKLINTHYGRYCYIPDAHCLCGTYKRDIRLPVERPWDDCSFGLRTVYFDAEDKCGLCRRCKGVA